jgi:hypothetical protein
VKLSDITVGNTVQITEVPPPVRRERSKFPETFALFERAIGRALTVRGFDDRGHVELWLLNDGSDDDSGAANSIWVEPEYLAGIGERPLSKPEGSGRAPE